MSGNVQPSLDRDEHSQTSHAKRMIAVDPFGGVLTEGNLAFRFITVGSISYLGKAQVGASTSDPVWQIQKINKSSGVVITWADGNDQFDNIFDNYAGLNYS